MENREGRDLLSNSTKFPFRGVSSVRSNSPWPCPLDPRSANGGTAGHPAKDWAAVTVPREFLSLVQVNSIGLDGE